MKNNLTILVIISILVLTILSDRSYAQKCEIDNVIISCQDIDANGNVIGLVFFKNGITTVSEGQTNIIDRGGYLELNSEKCTVISADKNIPSVGRFGKIQIKLPDFFCIIVSSRKLAINISLVAQQEGIKEQLIKVSVVNLKYEEGGKIYKSNIDSIKKIGSFAEALKTASSGINEVRPREITK